jgi:hypothetical protein
MIFTWLPQDHINSTDPINLIIRLEIDLDFHGEGKEVASQFANWAIASKPGNKHLKHVIDTAVAGICAIAERHNVNVKQLEPWIFPDVVNIVGPRRMAIAVLESLSGDQGGQ